MKKTINLALQGGGAHGAYTWGVLDRLLEEEDLLIEGISGTSAGALNGAALINGFVTGGREGARGKLRTLWQRISETNIFNPYQQWSTERFTEGWNMNYSAPVIDMMSRLFSPYRLNPLNINPLRLVLEDVLDLDAVHACSAIKLFVAATHVQSGQARIFDCEEMSINVLLASSCIPFFFQAVEIDGEDYWDGGYMGNPVIWPLIYQTKSLDVLLVQINPLHRDEVPRDAQQIIDRLNEISFNSSLIAEMRAIDFVHRLIKDGALDGKKYKDLRMHLIYSPEEMKSLNASSKMNVSWDFFKHLHDIGYTAAEKWLKSDWKQVGKRSTLDIRDKFLYKPPVKRARHSSSKQK